MKYVIFGSKEKPISSRTLSEFEGHRLKAQLSAVNEPLDPGEYEFYRDANCVIYNTNKRTRTAQGIVKRRAAALISAGLRRPVELYDEGLSGEGASYYFADMVRSDEELEFHKLRAEQMGYDMVLSMRKSELTPYVVLDNHTIKKFYEKYTFPEWFKPFVGMRHFRFMLNSQRFAFQTRRYNDSSKHSADEKICHDMRNAYGGIAKVYFSLFRCLDSKLEQQGKGNMIDLGLLTFDLDVKHEGPHLIDEKGLCCLCLDKMKESWEELRSRLYELKQPVEKVVFSGTKGLHVHALKEMHQQDFVDIIADINAEKELVDDFTYDYQGEKRFDMHRIFKVPGTIDSTTACVVDESWEEPRRVGVRDKVVTP